MDTYTQRQQIIERMVDHCLQLGVDCFVIAPGSRSAPLTTALAQRDEIQKIVVYDERAAGYVALGLAQQRGRAVGLVCTSGTATLNFAPAITEAFYQRVPLLVLTADRPPEWIDQQDNQAIHQPALYAPHILGSFEFPSDFTHPDSHWHAERLIAQAIHLSQSPVQGPVHVNFPLREPIYPSLSTTPPLPKREGAVTSSTVPPLVGEGRRGHGLPQPIRIMPAHATLDEASWDTLLASWQQAKRKLIIAGMHRPNRALTQAMQQLSSRPDVAVIADITANLYPHGTPLHHSDMIAGVRSPEMQAALAPDLVISFGGQVVSKYIKQLLRQLWGAMPPKELWQLHIGGLAPDPFQAMTHTVPIDAVPFFQQLTERITAAPGPLFDYANIWRRLEETASHKLADFIQQIPFGEFSAVHAVMSALPADSQLQLGNSMPIRYANLIAHTPNLGQPAIYSNRGTSGIDGTVSTAVGAALATHTLTTLIVGDLAFFYDRNGLWHAHLPANLRIVLLNNHGGGIFDMIEGPNRLERSTQERYFLTPQPLTARRTAEDHGLDYFHVNRQEGLLAVLPEFFAQRNRAAILEVETEMAVNTQIFEQFRQIVASLAA